MRAKSESARVEALAMQIALASIERICQMQSIGKFTGELVSKACYEAGPRRWHCELTSQPPDSYGIIIHMDLSRADRTTEGKLTVIFGEINGRGVHFGSSVSVRANHRIVLALTDKLAVMTASHK